jgi:hypothetical protein
MREDKLIAQQPKIDNSEIMSHLKFGVMNNSSTLKDFEKRCIEDLLSLNNISLELIIINELEADETSLPKLVWDALYKKYPLSIYRQLFCNTKSTKLWNMSDILSETPRKKFKLIKTGKNTHVFSDIDRLKIEEYKLDFIISFCSEEITGKILDSTKYGIWVYRFSNEQKNRVNLTGFWEIYRGDTVIEASLQRMTNDPDRSIILKKGVFKTIDYSFPKNVDNLHYESVKWPKQVAIDIQEKVADNTNTTQQNKQRLIYGTPNVFQLSKFIIKMFFNLFAHAYARRAQWNIGLINKPIYSIIEDKEYSVEWFPKPDKDIYLADPFGAKINGASYIFMEEYNYKEKKGKLSYIELDERNKPLELKTFIEKPYHMSYPYILEYEDEIYFIPETLQNKEVALYKLKDPTNWLKVKTLIEGIGIVDPSLIEYNDKWWLFFTREDTNSDTNLHIWYANDLMGEWISHKNNPVKSDVRSSRPAGTMFIHNGRLIRPSQDCSEYYGGRIVINEVTKISPTEFSETPIQTIDPLESWIGTHNLSTLGEITVIDGAITIRRDIAWYKNRLQEIVNYLSRK